MARVQYSTCNGICQFLGKQAILHTADSSEWVQWRGMLHDTYNRLGRILRTDPRVLLGMEERMNIVTGQEGVLEDVLRQNDIIVERTLASLGLTRRDPAKVLHTALIQRMMRSEEHTSELL